MAVSSVYFWLRLSGDLGRVKLEKPDGHATCDLKFAWLGYSVSSQMDPQSQVVVLMYKETFIHVLYIHRYILAY